MPSFVDLLAKYHGVRLPTVEEVAATTPEGGAGSGVEAVLQRFRCRMQCVVDEYSAPLLLNLPRVAAAMPERCASCSFDGWRSNEEATLRQLVAFLLPSLDEAATAAAAGAGAAAARATRETHGKRAASAAVLSEAAMAWLVELHAAEWPSDVVRAGLSR